MGGLWGGRGRGVGETQGKEDEGEKMEGLWKTDRRGGRDVRIRGQRGGRNAVERARGAAWQDEGTPHPGETYLSAGRFGRRWDTDPSCLAAVLPECCSGAGRWRCDWPGSPPGSRRLLRGRGKGRRSGVECQPRPTCASDRRRACSSRTFSSSSPF